MPEPLARADANADDQPSWPQPQRRVPLHVKILIGLLIGAGVGLLANAASSEAVAGRFGWDATRVEQAVNISVAIAHPLGKVFLRLVLMVVVPLVFSALALGVLELGDVRRLGRVGLRTLWLTLLLSVCAVGIGVTLVNLIQPGHGLSAEQQASLRKQYDSDLQKAKDQAKRAKSLGDTLLDIIPENPLQEMAGALDGSSRGNGMLAVMFFSLICGVALSMAGPRVETLVKCLEGVFDVTMTIIGFAMRIAPLGVACLVFVVTARMGFDILRTLAWFVLTVLAGMALQIGVVYPLAVRLVGRRSPLQFYRDISEATLTAFGTSSSNATLPVALEVAHDKLRLPREIAQFVLTIGATGNQNGTALYEGVVVLFLAQVFGVHLEPLQQVTVVLMSVLAGIGTAGVPGGSIPMIMLVLASVNVPSEGIGIILGIDRILDMCRTVLNVSGDLVLATCVARGETAGHAQDALARTT